MILDEIVKDKKKRLVEQKAKMSEEEMKELAINCERESISFYDALRKTGTLHGMKSYLLQDEDGNVQIAHSISAGLDYPGVGPEHAYLKDSGRATYVSITDDEAMEALSELCKLEGIIPAIESAHALAYAFKKTKTMTGDQAILLCLSGRGDKDAHTIEAYFKGEGYLN